MRQPRGTQHDARAVDRTSEPDFRLEQVFSCDEIVHEADDDQDDWPAGPHCSLSSDGNAARHRGHAAAVRRVSQVNAQNFADTP
jgi:hypothetical protein